MSSTHRGAHVQVAVAVEVDHVIANARAPPDYATCTNGQSGTGTVVLYVAPASIHARITSSCASTSGVPPDGIGMPIRSLHAGLSLQSR